MPIKRKASTPMLKQQVPICQRRNSRNPLVATVEWGREERLHPGRNAPAVQCVERGRIKRIPIEGEGANHDDDFDHHQPVERGENPLKDFFKASLPSRFGRNCRAERVRGC